jgi:predicted transposase YdaD
MDLVVDSACRYHIRLTLKKHRAEVMNVCMTEYNEEVFVNGMLEAGRQEGLQAGRADSIRTLLRKGKTMTEIHDLLDYPMEEIVEVSKKLQ